MLPQGGGLWDQPNDVIRRFEVIMQISDEDQKRESQRQEAQSKAKSGTSGI